MARQNIGYKSANRYDILMPRLDSRQECHPPSDEPDPIVPTPTWHIQATPVAVTSKSPLPLRNAVETCAIYFRREFGYDFVQYSATPFDKDDISARAFLWVERHHFDWQPTVGACCFRWREYTNAPHAWALQWIWMHPYARGKGLLGAAWPAFRQRFGDFSIEGPLSEAMCGFVEHHLDSVPEAYLALLEKHHHAASEDAPRLR